MEINEDKTDNGFDFESARCMKSTCNPENDSLLYFP